MPEPTDFDDELPTRVDTDVASETAEALAIDGPPDDASEDTPTIGIADTCGICQLIKKVWLANFVPAPVDCDQAWRLPCCGTRNGDWAWCRWHGLLSVAGHVTDCNRRKAARGGPPPGTPERRRKT